MYKIYNQLMKTISNSIKVLFAFCSIFLAFSCASSKNLQPALSPVYVTNTKKVNLLPPADGAWAAPQPDRRPWADSPGRS